MLPSKRKRTTNWSGTASPRSSRLPAKPAPGNPSQTKRTSQLLDEKLNEELAEYQESKSLEELADLLEVMGAVVAARGWTWDELTALRKEKRRQRGGFAKKILLKEVSE